MDASLTMLGEFTRELIGLPITHVWRGHGSAIFIEFGDLTPSKLVRKDGSTGNPKGQYGLMIDADWRIEKERSILCGSTSDESIIEDRLAALKGMALQEAHVVGHLPELSLRLTESTYVVTFRSDEGNPQWALADRRRGPPTRWLHVRDGRLEVELDPGVRAQPTSD